MKTKTKFILLLTILMIALVAILVTNLNSKAGSSGTKSGNVSKVATSSQKKKTAFFLPASENGDVEMLDYDVDDITSVNDIYKSATQSQIVQLLGNMKASAEYSLEKPLLLSNPFLTNTNSLYIYFKNDEVVSKLSYTVRVLDSKIPDYSNTLKNNSKISGEYEYLLTGLIANKVNTVTLTATLADGSTTEKTIKFTAPKLLSGVKNRLKVTDGESTQKLSDGLYALIGDQSTAGAEVSLVDNNGYIRNEIPTVSYNQLRLVFDDDGNMYFSISAARVVKMNRLGQVLKTYNLENSGYWIHHDFALNSEGNLVALATNLKAKKTDKFVEDRIIEINTTNGNVDEVLNFEDVLPDLYEKATGIDTLTNNKGYRDVVHANAIQLIDDETILISSRETSSIFKISNLNETPKLDYAISDESVWEGVELGANVLQKVGDFTSQAGQHSITYVPTADPNVYDIYLFNNNVGLMESRGEFKFDNYPGIGSYKATADDNSYYYRYHVDETAGTYELVEKFAVPYSPFISSVQNVGSNRLVDSGQKGVFSEYDSDGETIRTFSVLGDTKFIYRVYKYDFNGFYFDN